MAIEHIRDILERIPGNLRRGTYESPAEEMLGERLRSAIDPSAKFQTQVWVVYVGGRVPTRSSVDRQAGAPYRD